jgi:hypothetical protein
LSKRLWYSGAIIMRVSLDSRNESRQEGGAVTQPDVPSIETEDEPASTLTPERLLLVAVLGQVAKDLQSRDVAAARDAAEWVASPACDQFCALLDYDARLVRKFAAQHAR